MKDRDNLPPVRHLPQKHFMPYRSLDERFVGRVKDLWAVDDVFREKQTAVVGSVGQGGLLGLVVGIGGIGKTQLAIEYAHRFGTKYPGGVFWVDAERGISTLISRVSEGVGVDVDQILAEQDQLVQLWRGLVQSQPILIVLDNFPETDDLNPWLPSTGPIHILVTTRRRDLTMFSPVSLDFLTPEEGLILLNKGNRRFGEEGKKLVEALGGLPLALELARNFLNLRPALTIDGLLRGIRKIGKINALQIFANKYGNQLPTNHIKDVAATFILSWNLASDQAKSVLKVIARLAPTSVPRRLLRLILNIDSRNSLDDPLDESISELVQKLSLVELDDEHDPSLHRLIYAFVKTVVKREEVSLNDLARALVKEMARAADDHDTRSYRDLKKNTPHAEYLVTSENIELGFAMRLADNIGQHFFNLGYYRPAEKWKRKALDMAKNYYKPGASKIATFKAKLASVLKNMGELDEARELTEGED